MSDWKGHLKMGIIFEGVTLLIIMGIFIYLKRTPTTMELIYLGPILIMAPLFPDIDHHSSKITDFFLMFSIMGLWAAYFFKLVEALYFLILLSTIFGISRYVPHRGFTHSIWFVIIFTTGIVILSQSVFVGAVGCSGIVLSLIHI